MSSRSGITLTSFGECTFISELYDFKDSNMVKTIEKTLQLLTENIVTYIPLRNDINTMIISFMIGWIKTNDTFKSGHIQTLDLGAGIGSLASRVEIEFKDPTYNAYNFHNLAVEYSTSMLDIMEDRFKDRLITPLEIDLREAGSISVGKFGIPSKSHIISSVFLTSFLGQTYLQTLLKSVYDNLHPGGMFIIVDEMPTMLNHLNKIQSNVCRETKLTEAFPQSEGFIGTKVTLPIEMYLSTLKAVGFNQIDYGFKHGRITGLICLK